MLVLLIFCGALSVGSASIGGLLSSASANIAGAISALSASAQGYSVVNASDLELFNVGQDGMEMYNDDDPSQALLSVLNDPSFTLNCTGYFPVGIQCSTGYFTNLVCENISFPSNETITNLTTNVITGTSAFLTSITGTQISTNSFTGNIEYVNTLFVNTYSGTNMWVNSITGVSAHFGAYTGNKVTATQILVAPNNQGGYATFNQVITGTTIKLISSMNSPIYTGTYYTGSNAYFQAM